MKFTGLENLSMSYTGSSGCSLSFQRSKASFSLKKACVRNLAVRLRHFSFTTGGSPGSCGPVLFPFSYTYFFFFSTFLLSASASSLASRSSSSSDKLTSLAFLSLTFLSKAFQNISLILGAFLNAKAILAESSSSKNFFFFSAAAFFSYSYESPLRSK